MGSRINIVSVDVLDNPAAFTSSFKLKIIFEALEQLPHDIEWKLVYVGSGESSDYDQLLDSVVVGPTPEGRHQFIFEADAPVVEKIPVNDVVGVAVLLLRVKYNQQEFINLGWYVAVEYTDAELIENPPAKPIIEKLTRCVKVDDVRVTWLPIKWDDNQMEEFPPEQPGIDEETEGVIDMGIDAAVEEITVEEEEAEGDDEAMADEEAEEGDADVCNAEDGTENGDEENTNDAPTNDAVAHEKVSDSTPMEEAPLTDMTNA